MIESLAANGWKLNVGDPTVIGWIIFGLYLIASLLCLMKAMKIMTASKAGKSGDNSLSVYMWFGLSIILLLLGLNKQLDLQVLLFAIGRMVARHQGWIEHRREVQKLFALGFTFISSVFFLAGAWIFRKQLVQNGIVLIGMFCVLSFISIRAASFNHIDFIPFQLRHMFNLPMKYILEAGGILFVIYGALRKINEDDI